MTLHKTTVKNSRRRKTATFTNLSHRNIRIRNQQYFSLAHTIATYDTAKAIPETFVKYTGKISTI